MEGTKHSMGWGEVVGDWAAVVRGVGDEEWGSWDSVGF